jgi:hypothetical protein
MEKAAPLRVADESIIKRISLLARPDNVLSRLMKLRGARFEQGLERHKSDNTRIAFDLQFSLQEILAIRAVSCDP